LVVDSVVNSSINFAATPGDVRIYIYVLAMVLFIPFTLDTILFYITGKKGAPSIVRSTMALSLLFILGAVIFHLVIVVGITNNTASIVNNLLTILTGGVTAIIGFHFGGASARQSASQTETSTNREPNEPAGGDPEKRKTP
jgi:hypothetical protein